MRPTRRTTADTTDRASTDAATLWWDDLPANGGEGMVVKPHANLFKTGRGYAQPGVKVRGREFLRIIYGRTAPNPQTWNDCAGETSGTSARCSS